MPTMLKGLRINTIGSVDTPANQQALVALIKRNEPDPGKKGGGSTDEATLKDRLYKFFKGMMGGEAGAKDLNTVLADEQREDMMWKLTRALRESVESILEDNNVVDKQAAVGQVLQQFFTALVGSGVVKAGKKISAQRLAMLQQMQTMLGQMITEAEPEPEPTSKRKEEDKLPITDEVRKSLPEDVQKHLEDLEKKIITQAAPDTELAKRMEALEKRAEGAEKRAEEAEKVAKAEKEAREWANLVKRAESFPHIGAAEDVAKMIQAAYAISKENGEKLEATFKASNERIDQNNILMKEIGRGGSEAPDSAYGKLDAMAKGMVQKNTSMTYEDAFVKALEDNPELYSAYQAERRAN